MKTIKCYVDYTNKIIKDEFENISRVVGFSYPPTISMLGNKCYHYNCLGDILIFEEFDKKEDEDLIKNIFDVKMNQNIIVRHYNKGDSMSVLILIYNSKGAVIVSDSREFFGDNFEYNHDSKEKIFVDDDFILGQMGVNIYDTFFTYKDDLNYTLFKFLKENKDKTVKDFFNLEHDNRLR